MGHVDGSPADLSPEQLKRQWDEVCRTLKGEVSPTAFNTFLMPLEPIALHGDRLIMAVPTTFMRDWVLSQHADRIRSLWVQLNPAVRSVNFIVRHDHKPVAVADAAPARRNGAAGTREDASEYGALLDKRCTFETFVVGKPNEFAVAAAEKVASSERPAFNPLFLHGGVGLGKTHLMHAIAWRVRQRDPSRCIVYISAEKFMYQFVRALRSQDTMSFKELFRSCDLLMVDDLQFIGGKEGTQEEFFHTFNALVERGRQIVISADRSPSELSEIEERIRSRLSWGLVADIHPTNYELRLGILETKAEQLGADVPRDVLEFLSTHITSNVRELEGALNRVVHLAELCHEPMTIASTQEILQDVLRASARKISIEDIQKAVVEHYKLRLIDMSSTRRAREVARPRQVAMFLCKQLTQRSLPEIGRKFGDRDHTTVMHAIRTIERLVREDQQMASDVEALRRRLKF